MHTLSKIEFLLFPFFFYKFTYLALMKSRCMNASYTVLKRTQNYRDLEIKIYFELLLH